MYRLPLIIKWEQTDKKKTIDSSSIMGMGAGALTGTFYAITGLPYGADVKHPPTKVGGF